MSKAITFTQAQVRRAVKAAESAGLTVSRITIKTDGSIIIDTGVNTIVDSPKIAPETSWEDV